MNTCSLCKTPGHIARTCAMRPDATRALRLPEELVDVVMRNQLEPILRATIREPNMLKSLMIGCYLQGAVDAMKPEVREQLAALTAEAAP